MYVPPKFALTGAETSAALERGGFAQLVTHTGDGLVVTPLPLLYDPDRHSLVGHVARANPHWKAAGGATVAIFCGPQAYISPSFYPTKAETGKVVPTWNYDVLTVHGHLIAHDDVGWLHELVRTLTERHERSRSTPWQLSDAPETYIAGQLKGIVGVEVNISSVEGMAKMSQNQPRLNRDGVVAGLRESPEPGDHAVADRVESLGSTTANRRG